MNMQKQSAPMKQQTSRRCNGNCGNNVDSDRSATPILQSFVILNDDCEEKMCDNCGDQKLAKLDQIRKQKNSKG